MTNPNNTTTTNTQSVSSELTTLALSLTKQLTSIVSGLSEGNIKSSFDIKIKVETLTSSVKACKECAEVIGELDNIEIISMLKIYALLK